jgi:hypothetical protein
VLFESCLTYLADYEDIKWCASCLKDGGFVLATLPCRSAKALYPGVWRHGGRHLLDESELAAAFSRAGLCIVEVIPLGGVISRSWQRISGLHRALGRLHPKFRRADLLGPINRLANPLAVNLDRAFRFWRTGHCVVLEPFHKDESEPDTASRARGRQEKN